MEHGEGSKRKAGWVPEPPRAYSRLDQLAKDDLVVETLLQLSVSRSSAAANDLNIAVSKCVHNAANARANESSSAFANSSNFLSPKHNLLASCLSRRFPNTAITSSAHIPMTIPPNFVANTTAVASRKLNFLKTIPASPSYGAKFPFGAKTPSTCIDIDLHAMHLMAKKNLVDTNDVPPKDVALKRSLNTNFEPNKRKRPSIMPSVPSAVILAQRPRTHGRNNTLHVIIRIHLDNERWFSECMNKTCSQVIPWKYENDTCLLKCSHPDCQFRKKSRVFRLCTVCLRCLRNHSRKRDKQPCPFSGSRLLANFLAGFLSSAEHASALSTPAGQLLKSIVQAPNDIVQEVMPALARISLDTLPNSQLGDFELKNSDAGDVNRTKAASPELRWQCISIALDIMLKNMPECKTCVEVGLVNLEQLDVMSNAVRNEFLSNHGEAISTESSSGAAAATAAAKPSTTTTTGSASRLPIQWFKHTIKSTRRKVPVERLLLGRCGDRWYAITHADPTGNHLSQYLETSSCYLRQMARTPNRRVYVAVDPAYPIRAPLDRMSPQAELLMFFAALGQTLSLSGSKTLAVTVSRREKRQP